MITCIYYYVIQALKIPKNSNKVFLSLQYCSNNDLNCHRFLKQFNWSRDKGRLSGEGSR